MLVIPARLFVLMQKAGDQATCCRRRRLARANRPPQAASKPGRPAPTMGAGTAVVLTSDRSTLPASAVTSRKLKFPAPFIVVSCSQGLPGPFEPTQKARRLVGIPGILLPKTAHVSPAVALSAIKLMLTRLSAKLILAKLSCGGRLRRRGNENIRRSVD